jgi:hypothetical protein
MLKNRMAFTLFKLGERNIRIYYYYSTRRGLKGLNRDKQNVGLNYIVCLNEALCIIPQGSFTSKSFGTQDFSFRMTRQEYSVRDEAASLINQFNK